MDRAEAFIYFGAVLMIVSTIGAVNAGTVGINLRECTSISPPMDSARLTNCMSRGLVWPRWKLWICNLRRPHI